MNLAELFDLSFVNRAAEEALEFGSQTLTFGEIDERSNRLARALLDRGLRTGDRLAVYSGNSVEMVDLYLACIKTGVIFVPVNILYREREIEHILRDSEPRAVVTPGEDIEWPVPVWQPGDLAAEAIRCSPAAVRMPLDGDTPAALVYTSGTTGASKGAVLTHNNLAVNAMNLVVCWQMTSTDRLLLPLPLFHVHGLGNGLHSWLISGCRMRLLERFDRSAAATEFLAFRPTVFFGVPTIYVRLLEIEGTAAQEIGGSMRLFVSGSAPLPAQVLEEFRARFGHTILERYGMTETLMNISNPYAGERRAGTVGMPLPGVSVRILDDQGKPVADGETGELFIRGPNVCAGYWRRPDATEAAFTDGWFRTGDLAVRAPDGYFTLQGRRSDLIISGGFNIYPREVEETLEEDDAVAEAAVIGVPDRLRGEVPVAYIVPQGAVDCAKLEELCRRRLASFKVPRAFVTVDRLPRTALGKIQKHLLPKLEG
jgi:malonyl-CoA/methylmalonyl-CoA synthetase